jgi:hypothetical protein
MFRWRQLRESGGCTASNGINTIVLVPGMPNKLLQCGWNTHSRQPNMELSAAHIAVVKGGTPQL